MVTDSELLRLARKAWPEPDEMLAVETIEDGSLCVHGTDAHGGWIVASTRLLVDAGPRAREALHAALSVLAGELDVAALQARADESLRLLIECERERRDALADASDLRHGWDALRGKP
jgi:hypothetical protein